MSCADLVEFALVQLNIYRRYKIRHILIQSPGDDTAYKGASKNYFCLKKGFSVVSFTCIY